MVTLITGGTGFVGANLVKELATNGHEVVSMDLSPPDALMSRFIADVSTNITFVTGDILDQQFLDNIQKTYEIDRIIHAAVYTVNQMDLEIEKSREIIDINVMGTLNLINAAERKKCKQFIFASSEWVYDNFTNEEEKTEESIINIANVTSEYALSKLVSEANLRR